MLVPRWSKGTHYPHNYPRACSNGLVVGAMIAQVIRQFDEQKGLSLDRVNIIGFSLGCHVAGHVGMGLNGQARQVLGKCAFILPTA